MSTYKFKTCIKRKAGRETASTVEQYRFSRAECMAFLAKLNRKNESELNAGERRIKSILTDALSKPAMKTITITRKS